MKAIKLVVLFMGILIVLGIGLVVYGVIAKSNKTKAVAPADVSVPAPDLALSTAPGRISMKSAGPVQSPVPVDMPDLNLNQPEGSRIVSTSSGLGRLFMTIEGGGIAARVVIVDLSTGRISGTVRLGK